MRAVELRSDPNPSRGEPRPWRHRVSSPTGTPGSPAPLITSARRSTSRISVPRNRGLSGGTERRRRTRQNRFMASPRGGPSPTRDLQSVLAQSIPGLLQAPDCIRAVSVAARQWQTADEIEKFVHDRLARQERLLGDTPPELWAVASEAFLLQQVCGAQVMNDQLQRLPSRAERPDVTAQAAVLARGSCEYVRPERSTGLSGGGWRRRTLRLLDGCDTAGRQPDGHRAGARRIAGTLCDRRGNGQITVAQGGRFHSCISPTLAKSPAPPSS